MKNLVITAHIPSLNASVAGPKASAAIHRNIIKGEIDLIVITSKAEIRERGHEIDKDFYNRVFFIEVSGLRKWLSYLLNYSLPMKMRGRYSRYSSRKVRSLVKNLTPERIFFEFTSVYGFVHDFMTKGSNYNTIAIAHDYSAASMRSRYDTTKGFERFAYGIEKKMLDKYENIVLSEVNEIYVLSSADAESMIASGVPRIKVRTINLSADMWLRKIPRGRVEENTIFFLGSMNRIENENAVIWFITRILPALIEKIPNIKFYVIGRKPSKKVKAFASRNVLVTGFVEDVTEEIIDKKVSVCPLYQGAGVKVKVLETLELNIPTVCSPIGAQGIASNNNLYICSSESSYVSTIINLLKH